MNPDPPNSEPLSSRAATDTPAPGPSHDRSGAGHIPCVICTHTIAYDEYWTARCWTDPTGITCAAHAACLIRVGETDLDLPPAA